ncbi:endolysin [Roseobacter phage RDJL Phi 1]|uniref:Uncharacterized protein n=1 Tax=Roseobacter phage RDJL Phi 1 TaxID=562742 RepID=F4YXS2_9CAUD|nr:endolysin [Roseobacter phage RDJL Phi 1]ADK73462.1 hypothetical protein RDJLphi1_gp61 [Roseobacter phage RDJL Phi 1]
MTSSQIRKLQRQLNRLGYGPLDVDGVYGPKTKRAHTKATNDRNGSDRQFQRPRTHVIHATDWPINSQQDLIAFYGSPGGPQCTAGKVILPFPFKIAWDLDKSVSRFSCHEKVVQPMTGIFREAAAHYGEAEFRRLGLDLFGGCYNNRAIRGGSRKSTHAWGIAVDLDPARNRLRWGRDRAVFARPEYEPFWQIVEAYGATSLGRAANFDWMHFQFADQI